MESATHKLLSQNDPQWAQFSEPTRRWVEDFVVKYNLCPFAKPVIDEHRIAYQVSLAASPDDLLQDLLFVLEGLCETPISEVETSILIHPQVLQDFGDYNDFLDAVDGLLVQCDLDGVLQVASFHPLYQFAGTRLDDVENATNRSPFPMLHVIREESIERAIAHMSEPERIPERNIALLRELGVDAVKQVMANCMSQKGEGEWTY